MRSLQLVEFGTPLEWREEATPEPRGAEVLLRTLATGVCHSDLHLWEGYYGDGATRTYVKDRGVRLPLTMGHEIVGRGVAAVIDFVGSSRTASLGQAVLAKNGTLVIVGLFGGEMMVPTHFFPLRNATIRGSYVGSLAELRELLALVRERGVRPLPVACHPVDAVPHLLEEMRQGRVVGRAVVVPGEGPA